MTPELGTQPSKPAWLRVVVVDHAGGARPPVDVRVPIGLARFGLAMAKRSTPALQDLDLDLDDIAAAAEAGTGQVVHVVDEAEHRTVDVYVE